MAHAVKFVNGLPRAGALELSQAEKEILEMVLVRLREVTSAKATARLTFEIEVRDGGIMDKWSQSRVRER